MNPIINRKQDILYKDLAVDLTAHRVSRAGHELLLTRGSSPAGCARDQLRHSFKPQPAARGCLGLRLYRREPHRGRTYQRLRRKLGLQNDIQTVYKVGYRLSSAN